MKYLFDTNAVIYFITGKGNFPEITINDEISLSFITKIELLSWEIPEEENSVISDFINDSEIIYISEEIIQHTILLRKNHGLKIPDAIITATAQVTKKVLVTADKRIIQKVSSDLIIIDPLEML